jgi:hypothetical protein
VTQYGSIVQVVIGTIRQHSCGTIRQVTYGTCVQCSSGTSLHRWHLMTSQRSSGTMWQVV